MDSNHRHQLSESCVLPLNDPASRCTKKLQRALVGRGRFELPSQASKTCVLAAERLPKIFGVTGENRTLVERSTVACLIHSATVTIDAGEMWWKRRELNPHSLVAGQQSSR